MSIQFDLPKEENSIIKVIGVGGGGSNAVTHMFKQGIVGVNFMICNTDEQALEQNQIPNKIQLGPGLTEGRGAGSQPEVGRNATLESMDDIKQALGKDTKMIFITAGMGGGTGTGGAPVVARAARELGILTVGIVTTPFFFEGGKRIRQADKGIEELKENVDALIVISNDKMRELYGNLSLSEAFAKADDVLATAARGIAEIITVPGYVNVDFEDVSTVMRNSGVAIMGSGMAVGDDRALKAVKQALASPLLSENDIRGAQHILLNITSGTKEVLMDEVSEITSYIQEAAGYTSEVIWGNCSDESLEDRISVTVIATGFETKEARKASKPERVVISLDDEQPVTPKTVVSREPVLKEPQREEPEEDFSFNPQRYKRIAPKQEMTPMEEDEKTGNPHFDSKRFGKTYSTEEERMKVFMERRKRLRGLSMKLQSPSNANLKELENEPAYKRRNVQLEDTPHSSESNISKYSLTEDEKDKLEFKKRNPFLHDNVD
ncbi:MAG: cell division protein FtsZ [Chitinophagales bacterium]